MKKVAMALSLMLTLHLAATAQTSTTREQATEQIEAYKTRLNLTEEQTTQMKTILTKYRPEYQTIRKDTSKSQSEKLQAAEEVSKKQNEEVAAVLTEEQYTEWKKIQSEVVTNVKERKGSRQTKQSGGK